MNTKMEQLPAADPNPVLCVAKDGTVLYSNEASEPLLHEWSVAIGDKLPSYIGDFVKKTLSQNSPEKMEVKSGNKVYLVVLHPLPEQECVNIYGLDISDQKEIEKALRESEERLRNLGDNLPDSAVYQYAYEPDGTVRFLYISAGTEKLNGVKVSDVLNDANTLLQQIPPEYLKRLVEAEIRSARDLSDFDMDVPMLLPDGQMRWFRLHSRPRRMPDGRTVWDGVQIDITERKRTEQALMKSEKEYRQMAENIGEVFFIFTSDWRQTVYVSPAYERIWGRSPKDVYDNSMDWIEGVHPDDRWIPLAVVNKQIGSNTKEIEASEFRVLRPDGTIRWVFARAYPILDEQKHIYRISGIAEDITKRKLVEEALKEAHDTLEEKVEERTAELEKAYSSLKESEKSLAEAQELAHIGSLDRNIVTGEIRWSDELYRIFGLKPQEFEITYDLILSRYVHPDDRDHFDNAIKEALTGKPFSINYRIILANGEERIIHAKGEAVFDENNNPVRIRGITQDITEHKKAEEKLRENEEKYRNIVETANEGISIIDSKGMITYVNNKMADMLGYKIDEIIDKTIWDFIDDDVKPLITSQFEKRRFGTNESYEVRLRHKDGSPLWLIVNVKPFFDKSGTFTGSLNMHTDITERKDAEEKLRESEEKYRNIVETANEGIAIIDQKNTTTYANEKFLDMLGYDYNEFIGKPALNFVVDKEDFKEKVWSRHKGINDSRELELLQKDGSHLWIYVNVKALFDNDGEYIGSLGLFTDITERKKAEEALRESEERLRLAQKAAKIGSFEWNIQTGVNIWTPEMEAMYGLRLGEFGKTKKKHGNN